MREFIDISLYDPIHGYFCSSTNPVGFLEKPIDFNGLAGSTEYYQTVAEKYDGLRKHWLTPSEIFTPHIGSCIANYIVREWKDSSEEWPLEIIEVGAGTGTLARDILNWIKAYDKNIYEACTYVSIEISENLANLQHRRVCVDGGHSDERFSICIGNACNLSTWKGLRRQAPFVIAMEVLDNLPHDKVAYTVGRGREAEWMESLVSIANDGNFGQPEEHRRPVKDSLIKRALEAWLYLENESSPKAEEKILGALEWLLEATRIPDPIFLPTSALQLFDTIHTAIPRHQIIASDFDHLPDVKVAGRNAPLVSSIVSLCGNNCVIRDMFLLTPCYMTVPEIIGFEKSIFAD